MLVNTELRQRFLREARAAAALDHPNLVPVYESGEAGGVCYIASAYCPGITLAQWLQELSSSVPPRTAAALIACLADAVHHAHERGILHRDIKPSNVLLLPRPGNAATTVDSAAELSELDFIVKLTDFGLAKFLLAEADQATTGGILGTPAYMAPEQAEGWTQEVCPATDVYALGVILYELLTRRLPFPAAALPNILGSSPCEEPEAPRRLTAEVPRDLETICLKCLRKEPRQRYLNADALAHDLNRFLRHEPIQVPSQRSECPAGRLVSPSATNPRCRPCRPRPRHPRGRLVFGGVGSLAGRPSAQRTAARHQRVLSGGDRRRRSHGLDGAKHLAPQRLGPLAWRLLAVLLARLRRQRGEPLD